MQPRTFEPDAVLPPLKAEEARACVDAIKRHDAELRRLVFDLYERRGWEALGYESWRACVVTEFGDSQSYLYRQLEAAQTEHRISPTGEIGAIPERQLRPLTPLRGEPELQRDAWHAIEETAPQGKVTARHSENVVQFIRNQIDCGVEPVDAVRLALEGSALVSPKAAEQIARDTGVLVAGSDGMYHDGASRADKDAIAAEQRGRFDFFAALNTLGAIEEDPGSFASRIRPDQRYRVEGCLERAINWLAGFEAAWRMSIESPR